MATVLVDGMAVMVPRHTLLSEVLPHGHGVDLDCGGRGTCGSCRVIATGALTPLSGEELRHLTPEEQRQGVRLACCTHVLGDCTLTTCQTSGKGQILGAYTLPPFEQNPHFTHYGVVVDIGTTTVILQLYGADGLLSTASALNPQRKFGADVISRIGRSLSGDDVALAQCIRQILGELWMAVCDEIGIAPNQVESAVVVGNTAMLYLLTSQSPKNLSAAPFLADNLFGYWVSGRDLNLPAPEAQLYLASCAAAFVGADLVAAVLASGVYRGKEGTLLADLGTNGELALWHEGTLLCCSTAAGPALEGAGLSMGMSAKEGAIHRVWLEGTQLQSHVLGDGHPVGICSSGTIDALACLLAQGELDETGRLTQDPAIITPPVSITQQDVRALQLAKGAIVGGLKTLLHHGKKTAKDVPIFFIAGGMGHYLNLSHATAIGLIPQGLETHAHILGNAALCGGAMMLLRREYTSLCKEIALQAKHIDLSTDPVFMNAYIDGMAFEEQP